MPPRNEEASLSSPQALLKMAPTPNLGKLERSRRRRRRLISQACQVVLYLRTIPSLCPES